MQINCFDSWSWCSGADVPPITEVLWSVGKSAGLEFGELDSNLCCATNLRYRLLQATFLCLNFLTYHRDAIHLRRSLQKLEIVYLKCLEDLQQIVDIITVILLH